MLEPNPHDFLFAAKREANGSNARRHLRAYMDSGSPMIHALQGALFIGVYAPLLERSWRNGISIAPLQLCSRRFRHFAGYQQRRERMLWTILVILLVLWLIGFLGHIGGGLIHLLLVIALIVFIINLVSGRRAV
jgi:hypothetical protein